MNLLNRPVQLVLVGRRGTISHALVEPNGGTFCSRYTTTSIGYTRHSSAVGCATCRAAVEGLRQ